MQPDVLICSHPRSGGRWLRVLVAHYLSARHDLDWEVTPESVFAVVPDHQQDSPRGYRGFAFRHVADLPLVAVCHRPYSETLHRALPIVFLARNPYDVVVSAYSHLTRIKGEYIGTMRDFIGHPRLGLPSWIDYMNSWAPKVLTHRDVATVAYGTLDSDPAGALAHVLEFVGEEPVPALTKAAAAAAASFRQNRLIRTGQEGNFWDHLQPEEIFDIQELIQRGLSDVASHLLLSIGVDVDPFPRDER